MSESTATTPGATQADEQTNTQPPNDEDSGVTGESLLAALDDTHGEDAPSGAGTESEAKSDDTPVDPETREAIEARIRAELEEQTKQSDAQRREEEASRRAAEAAQTERQKRKDQFGQAAPALRSWAEDKVNKQEPLTQADVNGLLDWFTQFNGAVGDILSEAEADRLYDAAAKQLPEKQRADFLAKRDDHQAKGEERHGAFVGDLVNHLTEQAREGYVKSSEAKKDTEDALLRQWRRLQENPALLTTQTNGARDHSGGAADRRSDDEILMDPNTPLDKIIEIRNRQEGRG